MKVSKNHVVCPRCHLVGLASGIDWIAQSSAESGAAIALVARRAARSRSRRGLAADGEDARCWRSSRSDCFMRLLSRPVAALASMNVDPGFPGCDLADHRGVRESFVAEDREDFVTGFG